MARVTIKVESDEYAEDGIYCPSRLVVVEHDTDLPGAETWTSLLETFKEVLAAMGYAGVEERVVVLKPGEFVEDGKIKTRVEG